jgi:hypothetical protein
MSVVEIHLPRSLFLSRAPVDNKVSVLSDFAANHQCTSYTILEVSDLGLLGAAFWKSLSGWPEKRPIRASSTGSLHLIDGIPNAHKSTKSHCPPAIIENHNRISEKSPLSLQWLGGDFSFFNASWF